MTDDQPTIELHTAPCPKCGRYRTTSDIGEAKLRCLHCGHEFFVSSYPHRWKDVWSVHAQFESGHEYLIQRDRFYGKRWLLWINVHCSGFWFLYAARYTLRGAKRAARHFEDSHDRLLTNPEFLSQWRIPGGVATKQWRITPDGEWERAGMSPNNSFKGMPLRGTP